MTSFVASFFRHTSVQLNEKDNQRCLPKLVRRNAFLEKIRR